MFKIGKEFHLLHVVSDLDAADEWYDRVFSARRFVRKLARYACARSLAQVGSATSDAQWRHHST